MKYLYIILGLFFSLYTNAQVNLNLGLVAYYPFNGNTNDASGNGNNATNYGPILTTDQGGNANSAYYFDGVNDYMRISNTASLNFLPQISLAAKVKVQGFYNGVCYGNCIIDKGLNDYVPGSYTLRFSPGMYTLSCFVYDTIHQNYSTLYNGLAPSATIANNVPYVQEDQWDCLVYTFDGTTHKLWVNGVLRYQYTGSSVTAINTDDIFLGRKNDVQFPYWFKGVMDEVRIYNRALNTQEVDSLCGFNPPPPDTVINKYGAVLDRLPCSNTLVIDTATDFNVGDTILMIQMKGAVIDSSNSAAFGTVTNYKGAGNYEYNVIKAKTGNALTLKHPIVRDYDIPEGKVQLVRIPSFQNYTVNQPHTCMPWNGSKGGVFAITVANTLTLNNNIDISGKGFRGGVISNNPDGGCGTGSPDYYYPLTQATTVWSAGGAEKGEGITILSPSRMAGRGPLATGGGGGNKQNTGGGGGSNYGSGGLGGNALAGCTSLTPNGGLGGVAQATAYTFNKVFLGGGGGCGDDNDGVGSAGEHGGGLVLINAGILNGNSKTISANGKNQVTVGSGIADGAGGGGAGGTLLLKVGTFQNVLSLSAKGGKGGNQQPTYGCVGPGGGGGGGLAFATTTLPANVNTNFTAGAAGMFLSAGMPCTNTTYGAQPGQPGQPVTGLQLNFPVDTFSGNSLIAAFSDTAVDCFTYKFNDQTAPSGAIISRNWDFASGGTSVLQAPVFTFPGYGTYPVTLTVTDSSGCNGSITKEINIPYIHFANAGNDTALCDGSTVLLQASGGVTYSWSPTNGLSNPNAATTSATISGTATYVVMVTDSKGCKDSDTVIVTAISGGKVAIVSEDIVVNCQNSVVRLTATGALSYVWHPGGYCDDSTSATPNVRPPQTTLFTVIGTSAEGCTSQDTITVISYNGNAQLFMPNAFSPNADGRNDKIRPIILCGFTMEQFAVFNRWGERIFITNNPGEGWDGFYKGKAADAGTYYYYIKGKKEDRSSQTFKGNITLIR